jgi:hypothetical protein
MRKGFGAFVALALLAGVALVPARSPAARAQAAAPAISCSGAPEPSPMQGHYTGTWHSDGLYHFNALGHDIQLTVTIDGTIDVTVTPDGQMSGTVQGNVQAPVTHEGQRDVSSGYGTISGPIQGVFSAGGSIVLLPHPTILMHWGTFVGGGYTEDRTIVMPDYQLPVAGFDCISAQGTIAENGFPEQNIVDDANGTIAQIPGIGTATGTWSITSDSAAKFASLSQQVDALIGASNVLLGNTGTPLSPAAVEQQIVAPLKALEAAIEADPTVARCLLDRLGAWEMVAVRLLQARAQGAGVSDLLSLRHAADAIRAAQSLNLDCQVALDATAATITAAGESMLDASVNARSWSQAALLARELILLGGDGTRAPLQTRLNADLHAQLAGRSGLLGLARAAYLLGDDADATTAAHLSSTHTTFREQHLIRRVGPRSGAPFASSLGAKHLPRCRRTPGVGAVQRTPVLGCQQHAWLPTAGVRRTAPTRV